MHTPTSVRTGRPIVLVAGDGDLADSTLLVVTLWGFQGLAAPTPERAVATASGWRPDVVVSALPLDAAGGERFAAAVRAVCPPWTRLVSVRGEADGVGVGGFDRVLKTAAHTAELAAALRSCSGEGVRPPHVIRRGQGGAA